MAFIRAAFVVMLTVFAATLVYTPSAVFVLLRKYPLPSDVHVSVNVVSLIHLLVYWLIAIAAFALGFYWQFRRRREASHDKSREESERKQRLFRDRGFTTTESSTSPKMDKCRATYATNPARSEPTSFYFARCRLPSFICG